MQDLIHNLEKLGWFKSWPDFSKQQAHIFLSKLSEKDASSLTDQYPLLNFLNIWGDGECIEGDGSYTAILEEFAEDSFGLFQPVDIEESWEGEDVSLSFFCGGQQFSIEFETYSDYVSDECFHLIQQALTHIHPEIMLYTPEHELGQEYAFLFGNKHAIEKAKQLNMLPAEPSYND